MPVSDKHILLVSAHNDNQPYLQFLREELERIRTAVLPIAEREGFFAHPEFAVTLRSLFDRFNTKVYDWTPKLLHYCGHSSREEIFLSNALGSTGAVTADDFATFLNSQPKIEVVFLNSCSSQEIGRKILEGSPSVKAVIETTAPVGDQKAADFAYYFYLGLAAGKSLKEAFLQASTQFGDQLPSYHSITDSRGVGRAFMDETETKLAWRLSYREEHETLVNQWRIKLDTLQDFMEDPRYTAKILCLFEDDDLEYYEAIDRTMGYKTNLLLADGRHMRSIITQEERDEILKKFDGIKVFLGANFYQFWPRIAWLSQYVGRKPIKLIYCGGAAFVDYKNHMLTSLKANGISDFSTINDHSIEYSLNRLKALGSLRKAIANFFKKDFETFIDSCVKTINKEQVEASLQELNYQPQKDHFTHYFNQTFKHQKINFLLIEGTPKCGHEFLIKLLLKICTPEFYSSDMKPSPISIKSKIPLDELDRDSIWQEIRSEILGVGSRKPEKICRGLLEILHHRNLILFLNDWEMGGNSEYFKDIIRQLWLDLQQAYEAMTEKPSHQLLMIITNKEHELGCSVNELSFDAGNGIVLEPIKQMDRATFNYWFANQSHAFDLESPFFKLAEETAQEKIVEIGYMKEVVAEICKILGFDGLSGKLMKL